MNSPKRHRILVNAIPAVRVSTGIGRYILSLYAAMRAMYADSLEIAFFVGDKVVEQVHNTHATPGAMASSSPFWKLPPRVSAALRHVLTRKREAALARHVREYDLFHETSFFPPPLRDVPVLFTLHDMSLLRFPGWHPLERAMFFDAMYSRRYRYADALLAVSHHTRSDCEMLLPQLRGLPVTVTHLGIDREVFHPRPEADVAAVLQRHGLPERFALTVGSGDPRKNVDSLIRVFSGQEWDLPLVVAGWEGWHAGEASTNVIRLGYISDADLACLYTAAVFFVYPSFHEGFGLPVLEAMSCGCPVLASRVASIPEVGRGRAVYFNPRSGQDLAAKVGLLAKDAGRARAIRQSLLESPPECGWEKTAAGTYEAICSLLQ